MRKDERVGEGKPEEEEEEEEEEDDDCELSDEEELASPHETDDPQQDLQVFEGPTPQSDTSQTGSPVITVAPSVNRSGRMNLFSLMQSISDEDKGREQLLGSPRRSPVQRMYSQGRRSLMHQRACVDVSPESRSLPEDSESKP
uniref:Uncharacterized protein n=2 Tax=Gasterosteus aculeatus TaxID=69293 RepID=G3Q1I4_GASAC